MRWRCGFLRRPRPPLTPTGGCHSRTATVGEQFGHLRRVDVLQRRVAPARSVVAVHEQGAHTLDEVWRACERAAEHQVLLENLAQRVLVAEIGDVSRFASASKLTCWAGLTPKHHESDTHVRRGRITKQGSRLVRWAAIESVKTVSKGSEVGVLRERVGDRRGRNIGSVAAARLQLELVFYALRDGHVRALEHLPRVA
jgi:transposase